MAFLQNCRTTVFPRFWIYFTKENLGLIWTLDLKVNGQDFIKTKSYLASNLGR
jgi:hypothetical protein